MNRKLKAFLDVSLSAECRCLYGVLISLKNLRGVTIIGLSKILGKSYDTTSRYMRELVNAGYVERLKKQDRRGRFTGWNFKIRVADNDDSVVDNRFATVAESAERNRLVTDNESEDIYIEDIYNTNSTNSNTKTSTRKISKKKSSSSKPSWLSGYNILWRAKCGGDFVWGQAGKLLRPLEAEHGRQRVIEAFAKYMEQVDPQFASLQTFASKIGIYLPKPKKEFVDAGKKDWSK